LSILKASIYKASCSPVLKIRQSIGFPNPKTKANLTSGKILHSALTGIGFGKDLVQTASAKPRTGIGFGFLQARLASGLVLAFSASKPKPELFQPQIPTLPWIT
jgi:hypothetical protein